MAVGSAAEDPSAGRAEGGERSVMARAVRETFRKQVADLLESRGLAGSADLRECQRCGERTILPGQPATFARDPRTRAVVCTACRAEQDFVGLFETDDEIGGEG
ncbi:MAG: hypothetical protein HY775_01280 [Acidobacteria bacterium]|nr:hypothetical protein [Acidobacteriota bacterium]